MTDFFIQKGQNPTEDLLQGMINEFDKDGYNYIVDFDLKHLNESKIKYQKFQ